jgi:hypothetical protein
LECTVHPEREGGHGGPPLHCVVAPDGVGIARVVAPDDIGIAHATSRVNHTIACT